MGASRKRVRGAMQVRGAQGPRPVRILGPCGVVQVDGSGDVAVARLASAQRGVVSYRQLAVAGLGRGAIAHRLANGRLHRLHRGVYLVGHPVPPPLAREVAALLACGNDAVLSHQTAGALWGIVDAATGVDVVVSSGDPRGHAGIRVHRVRPLDAVDVRRHQRLPITSPARTLMDLAAVLGDRALERAVNEALVRRLTSEAELQATLRRLPGRRGVPLLRALLERSAGPALTRSEAEVRLLDLVRRGQLPRPETNVAVLGHEVDVLWRSQRLVVEIDGYAFHSSRAAFERDRARDAKLLASGWRVLRITWRQLVDEPEAALVRIAGLLAGRSR